MQGAAHQRGGGRGGRGGRGMAQAGSTISTGRHTRKVQCGDLGAAAVSCGAKACQVQLTRRAWVCCYILQQVVQVPNL
jgi:hypothetical protein